MFGSKIRFLPKREGERFASALTNISLSNKIYKHFGKINLKDYIADFLKKHKKQL
jgi:UDP-glucose 4-epimerase